MRSDLTPALPADAVAENVGLFFQWLGPLWTRIYEDTEFPEAMQLGQANMLAQSYLNSLEAFGVLGRETCPVLHREHWYPVVLRRSERNTGRGNLVRVGMPGDPVVGPQQNNALVPGKVLTIGGNAEYANVAYYPLPDDASSVLTCVTDNLVAPSKLLYAESHFVIDQGTIFFLHGTDPFENPDFPRRTIINSDGVEDEEILVWGCDVMFDRDYLYDHVGYALSIRRDSSAYYKNMLNGLWELYNMGTPLAYFWAGLGALLGEPTVLGKTEVVDRIIQTADKLQVVTNTQVYTLHPDARLRDAVAPGAVLGFGEYLSETIRVYDNLLPDNVSRTNEYGTRLPADLPGLFINERMFGSALDYGLAFGWELTDIINAGPDANGNPRLYFETSGAERDKERFWSDFWSYYEDAGISSETCFSGYLDAIVTPVEGAVYGRVSPLEYVFRYFLGANTALVVVERDRLPVNESSKAIALVSRLRDILPAHVLVFFVEQRTLSDADYDLTVSSSATEVQYAKQASEWARPGGPSETNMQYLDRQPTIRWVPAQE